MKNVLSYALGLLLLSGAAQAASQSPAQTASRMLPRTGAAASDRKAVSQARVKLMKDVRELGPDSAEVQADKQALINAMEKMRGDTNAGTRPVNVKRNPKKVKASRKSAAKRTKQVKGFKRAKSSKRITPAKSRARLAKRKGKTVHAKVSHRHARNHARVA